MKITFVCTLVMGVGMQAMPILVHAAEDLPGMACQPFHLIAQGIGTNCNRCKGQSTVTAETFTRDAQGSISVMPNLSPDAVVPACGGQCAGVTVDWGDGSQSSAGLVSLPAKPAHTYTTAGTYYVRVCTWGQFKYHGNGSCSYECRSPKTLNVEVRLPGK